MECCLATLPNTHNIVRSEADSTSAMKKLLKRRFQNPVREKVSEWFRNDTSVILRPYGSPATVRLCQRQSSPNKA
jgi:hypothetical protein